MVEVANPLTPVGPVTRHDCRTDGNKTGSWPEVMDPMMTHAKVRGMEAYVDHANDGWRRVGRVQRRITRVSSAFMAAPTSIMSAGDSEPRPSCCGQR